MKISEIPVAVNHARTVSGKLTQYNGYEKTNISSGGSIDNLAESCNLTSLIASDNDYTRKDALLKQWNKQSSFNLYDVLNGAEVSLKSPNPTADELEAFEKTLQEDGVGEEIDWNEFAFDLKGIGFDTSSPTFHLDSDDFSRKVDYLASRYAAMQNKIQTSFLDGEQTQQLEKLNTIYEQAVKELAGGYTEVIGSFLEKNGVSGERENIYDAVVNGIREKAEGYTRILNEDSSFTEIKGASDRWLSQDDEYVAALLRKETVETGAETTRSSKYTLSDLDVLGRYTSELSKWESSNIFHSLDEERIGLDFAMLSMKTTELQNSGKLSASSQDTLQKLVNGYMENFLNRMDDGLSKLRNENKALYDTQGYAALNRQAIASVYNKTMKEYQASGDAVKALIQGAEYGISQRNKGMNGTYRSRNSQDYWNHFFKNTEQSSNPYTASETTLQKYANGWFDFKKRLKSGDDLQLNICLRSTSSYSLSTNANLNKFA